MKSFKAQTATVGIFDENLIGVVLDWEHRD